MSGIVVTILPNRGIMMVATIIVKPTWGSDALASQSGVPAGPISCFSRACGAEKKRHASFPASNYGNWLGRPGCSLSRRLQMTKKHSSACAICVRMSGEKMGKLIELSGQNVVRRACGFTLIEVIVVVVILAIVALMAVPMFGSAADIQLKAAANMIAADLEYAKSMAISRQQPASVVFNSAAESYEVRDKDSVVIPHPINPGDLAVDFPSDSRLNQVVIASAVFDPGSAETITFDYLGSPYSGSPPGTPLISGTISLQAGSFPIMTITIEPITGYVTIDN